MGRQTISVTAGTFSILHEGHKRLIWTAFDAGDEVIIGLTSDGMASGSGKDAVPFYLRKKELELFLADAYKPWEIIKIEDIYGPREKIDAADVIVVSEETVRNAEEVNRERCSRGIRPLEIVVIPVLGAYDGGKISSTGIMDGRYSRDGGNAGMRIAVGSANRIKVEAVRSVMERIFGSVIVIPVEVESGVPKQPAELETRTGAINRAAAALGSNDLSVGIEAGVWPTDDGLYDFQYCAILDKEGRLTVGIGPGFRYPDDVAELVSKGMTVGEAFCELYGHDDIGKKQGAVGLLSKGLLDRKTLTEQSVITAMIPRMNDL
ncbi:MAG: inosine/xanthosine triphosphatase [Candidatus Methanoplasma sp.]|jgi:inosine/xanthosine triphosphatase|nr:inosine/xanthosine triphosphatase [Candidatus Methanoplasma sp.]